MKKNDFGKYQKGKNKAPEFSLGSRLLRILLTGGCIAAAATAILSLTFYFFPVQSENAVHGLQHLASQIYLSLTETEPAAPSQEETISETADSEKPTSETFLSFGERESLPTPSPPAGSGTDIPMLVPSNEQGDVRQIGEQEEHEATDEDYLVMLDTAMGPMLYYNQGDSRWGDYLYGGVDPIRYYGCGPTVAAMLINAFTETPVTPKEMADWCADNRCHASHSGSYHSIVDKTLTAYGLQVESAAGADFDTAAGLLRSGHVLVALMGKGEFTGGGHFIIITNLLESGNVRIADCNSFENTKKEWDLNQVLAELNRARDSGAPLWAVSVPIPAENESN